MSKERIVPAISWMTNIDNGKQCGNVRYRIIASMTTTGITENNFGYPYINGEKIYARILIQRV